MSKSPRIAIYAGSFDPPTMGHMFMIRRAAKLFDHLVVAVGVNPGKTYTFSLDERVAMLQECVEGMQNVEVDRMEARFLVRYAREKGADAILRGIRSDEDYRYEHAMHNINMDIEPEIVTVFLMPPRDICEISSGFVKGLIGFEGWQEIVRPYVPKPVYRKLTEV
jgi:pantetheine-phosphate adenylyltransferase